MKKLTSILLIALASLSYTAQAALVEVELDTIFNETDTTLKPTPAGAAPWLIATFEAQDLTTVRLTMDSMLQDPNEFVSGWYFNLNTAYNASNLVFTEVSASGAAYATSIMQENNAYRANGERFYDIVFDMDIAPPTDRFNNTDQLVYDIQLSDGAGNLLNLNELDFDFFGVNGNEKGGPFTSAAHIQGLTGDLSTWIGGGAEIVCTVDCGGGPPTEVPEPSTLFLLGSALLALSLRTKTY